MNPLNALTFSMPPAAGAARGGGMVAAGAAFPDEASSSRTSISDLGRALSRAAFGDSTKASDRYQDIDDSDLPDIIKNLLRMIRDLKARLAELMQELQAVQADRDMDPELKRARLLQIRSQMSALNSALISASQKLASLMREMKLDAAQQMTAGQLALK